MNELQDALENGYETFGFYIPDRMLGGLRRWIYEGEKPGHFLSAVLKNDLMLLVDHADNENRKNIPAYTYFLYNVAPGGCYGSEEKFEAWAKSGGLNGQKEKTIAKEGC